MEIHDDDKLCKIFIHQMTKKETSLRAFFAGGFAEIDEEDFNNHPSDVDIMCYPTYILGLDSEDDKNAVISKSFKGRLIRHTQNHPDCHPGYTKIESGDSSCREITSSPYIVLQNLGCTKIKSCDNSCREITSSPYSVLQKPDHRKFVSDDNSCRDITSFPNSVLLKHCGPALTLWMMRDPVFWNIDFVYCLSCQGWPTAASTWKNRPRTSGWPTDDLVEKVISGGYHLVNKPHPWHGKNVGKVFWRISFSRSECLLMRSLNEVQKRVYALLRKIKTSVVQDCKRENGSVLSTYLFKTAMLWLCEEKSNEFWKYENIPMLIEELLNKIIVWLIDRNCPNYFIPENNMLDHHSDDLDLEWEITSLVEIAETNWFGIENQIANSIRKHELPIPMNRNSTKLVMSEKLKSAYGIEFEIPFDQDQKYAKLNDFDDYDNIIRIFSAKSDDVEVLSLLYVFLCKWQLDLTGCHVDAKDSEIFGPCQNISSDKELLLSICSLSANSDKILPESISRSDAINLTLNSVKSGNMFSIGRAFFVVCGYLANIYFSVEKDYTNAMLISQTLIDACTSCVYFVALSELSFPMLLSSRFSRLFDDNVRVVHGFLTLFRSIVTENQQLLIKVTEPHSTIKLCSILFLRYIKAQLEMKSGDDAKIESAVKDFFSHLEHNCPTDGHNWSVNDELSRCFLSTILLISLVKSNKHWILDTLKWPPPNLQQPATENVKAAPVN